MAIPGRPLVSVLTPAFNAASYLRDASASILAQTLGDLELLIIDDGSTDRSVEIAEQIAASDGRVRVIRQAHAGLVAALNHGMDQAKGRLIARMDADDIAVPDRLARQVAFLADHPEVAVVGMAVKVFSTEPDMGHVVQAPTEPAAVRQVLLREVCVYHPTVVFRPEVIRAVGGYRANFFPSEDYDLWLRVSERADIANLPEVGLYYRRHLAQIGSQRIADQVAVGMAARMAAQARRAGRPDSFANGATVTWERLAQLGAPIHQMKAKVAVRMAGLAAFLEDEGRLAEARTAARSALWWNSVGQVQDFRAMLRLWRVHTPRLYRLFRDAAAMVGWKNPDATDGNGPRTQ